MKTYFAFDLETTGVDVVNDEPVEIAYAIVREDGSYAVPPISHLVNTSRAIHPKAAAVHGITREQCQWGFSPTQTCHLVRNTLTDYKPDAILGFNCYRFDVPMMANFMKRYINDDILLKFPVEDPALWYLADEIYKTPRPITNDDNRRVSQIRVPFGTRFNLSHLCTKFEIKRRDAHRAQGDIEATIEIWKKMKGPNQGVAQQQLF